MVSHDASGAIQNVESGQPHVYDALIREVLLKQMYSKVSSVVITPIYDQQIPFVLVSNVTETRIKLSTTYDAGNDAAFL